jgi:hypothetical protein
MASKVRRKLTFYAWKNGLKKQPFDRLAAAKTVKKLEGKKEVIADIDGSLSAVLVQAVGTDTTPTRFLLLPLRDFDNRPLRFRPGTNLQAISLGENDYTSDVSHVVIWPDGYAAYDAHGFAPGPNRLGMYLREKAEERVAFFALYDRELIKYLRSLKGLTAIEFSITNSDKGQRAADTQKGIFEGLLSARKRTPESVSFGQRISTGGRKGQTLDEEFEEDILELAERADDYFDSLHVTGIDPQTKKSVTINVLQTRLHVEVEMPRAQGGGDAPNPKTCFSELDKAKTKLGKKKLEEAARAGPST